MLIEGISDKTMGLKRGVERKTGFEPATSSLARRCSTTEPLPRVLTSPPRKYWGAGAEGQNRTVDTGIFSAVLYQLSYLGRQHYLNSSFCALSRKDVVALSACGG